LTAPRLHLVGLEKSYGAVRAVAGVDLAVAAGEVLAIVGENGAGKSTVVNMIAGMTAPDRGHIRMNGHLVVLDSARAARERGIGVVHQHYALVPGFTVAESLALGQTGPGRLDRRGLAARVRALADEVGIAIDPDARIGSLDVAGQQRVEILKALSRPVEVLVLDEPTAVLTPEDADRLFAVVSRLRARGVSVLLVTHKLSDVFRFCDRAAVMHAGRLVCDRPVADLTAQAVVSLMIAGTEDADEAAAMAGRLSGDFAPVRGTGEAAAPVPPTEPGPAAAEPDPEHGPLPGTEPAPAVLRVADVTLRRANGSVALAGLTFDLHPGEILAVAGVDGNGQSELVACLAGLARPAAGHVAFAGLDSREARGWTPGALRAAGLAHVPDDRRRLGIAGSLPLTENMILSHLVHPRYRRGPLLDRRRARADTETAIRDYAIRTTGPDQAIGLLSGGNQQKLVLARELLGAPVVLLAAQPSRGLDIRTIAAVQDRLRAARDRGAAILLVSADLGEIWRLADRVLVLAAGRAFGPVALAATSRARIGAWMAGHAA